MSNGFHIILFVTTQPILTCSNPAIETLQKGRQYVQKFSSASPADFAQVNISGITFNANLPKDKNNVRENHSECKLIKT